MVSATPISQRTNPVLQAFNSLFTVQCQEGDKLVDRSIGPLIFTPENGLLFYERASKYPVIFGKPISNPKQFWDHFAYVNSAGLAELNGMFWCDPSLTIVFYITNIYPTEADVHYTFLDGRQKGREELVKTMLSYIFAKYKYIRLNANIPLYAKSALHFARQLGFVEEGRKRKCAYWKGEYFDEIQFGMLAEEIFATKE